jgi:hypothetical protein
MGTLHTENPTELSVKFPIARPALRVDVLIVVVCCSANGEGILIYNSDLLKLMLKL